MATHNGVTLGPNSPARGLRAARSEKVEQALCDDLVAKVAGREHVVSLSQYRASNVTEGLPDRRYRLYGTTLWWETKAADGKLTAEQHKFLAHELAHGALAGCGTLEDLQETATHLQRLHAASKDPMQRAAAAATLAAHCIRQVGRWAEKGYRPTKPSRRRR